MKWKKEIIIKQEKGYILMLDEEKCRVKQEDEYLVKVMKRGIEKNEELKTVIMKEKQVSDAVAGFILAQFILDYQEFIENDNSYFEIVE